MTTLFIAGYLAVALLCVYGEGRLTGAADLAPAWMIWPLMLPILLIAWVFAVVADAGERHSK